VALLIWFMSGEGVKPPERIAWGVTFSPRQTEYLGLDAGKVYLALLDDMKVSHLRLMAPWYKVEPQSGQYDFSDVDWYLREAQKRGAKVVLALGRKLFRWPECHEPEWPRAV
jgi:beta-galactosidase GanA